MQQAVVLVQFAFRGCVWIMDAFFNAYNTYYLLSYLAIELLWMKHDWISPLNTFRHVKIRRFLLAKSECGTSSMIECL